MHGTDKCVQQLGLMKKIFRISLWRAWSACDPSIDWIYRVHQRDDSRCLRKGVTNSIAAGYYTDTKNALVVAKQHQGIK
jgi:hypothetical protein